MNNKTQHIKPTLYAIGMGVAISLGSTAIASATSNPFTIEKLSSGYNLASSNENGNGDKGNDGKCGHAKCGNNGSTSSDSKSGQGKCGQGKCSSNKE